MRITTKERWLSLILSENIRSIRKAKGLSQEEFSIRLYVVRQTVSKWERGLSVPDSEMLIRIAEILETPVSVLLGETQTETEEPIHDWNVISEKLEVINLQLARKGDKTKHFTRVVYCNMCTPCNCRCRTDCERQLLFGMAFP